MKFLAQISIYFFILFFSNNINSQVYDPFYDSIVSNVSNANILADLTTFESLGVKSIGTTALDDTQNWIKTRYQNLGYTDIVEQPFSYSGNTTNNIIVTKTGSVYPDTYLIIDAHYDTINGPGTNDNGSGTVLIMELARLLKDIDTEYSIKFIHFSGEEDGLIGSNYYVNNTVNPGNLDILLVFNIDEVGGVSGLTNDTIVCEQDQSNPPGNNAASATATNSLAVCVGLYSNLSTEISFAYASDYVPFENNGEIITGLYEKNESPYAHTANDLLVNMDVNYLFEVTKASLGAALYFAIAVGTLDVDDFSIQENNFVIYPNPTNGVLNINYQSSTSVIFDLKIVDIVGKEVYHKTISNQTETINLTNLNKGLYFAIFKNDKTSVTKKIILK